jgi:hypothetical protein
MKKCPGQPFFNMVTPSDIAYVLEIIKNGKDSRDQTKRLGCTPGATQEKKIQPLFSRGDGKMRLKWYYCMEQCRAGVLLHGREELEGGI